MKTKQFLESYLSFCSELPDDLHYDGRIKTAMEEVKNLNKRN